MNVKTWAPLAAALVLGLAAALIARNSMGRPDAGAKQATLTIVTLKRDVNAGQEIAAQDVTASELSSPVAPPGTFSDPAEVVGRVAITAMGMGQPVLEPLLARKGTAGGLQALVPHGMRAITIDVSETTGVAGLIGPGCLVDVLLTINDPAGAMTRTLVQGVKVQAVGRRMGPAQKDGPPEVFNSVTLLVSPSDAETVELACATGRPRLVLRGNADTAASETTGVTLADLRGADAADAFEPQPVRLAVAEPATRPAAEPVAESQEPLRRRVVKVIKGGVESTVTFESRRGRAATYVSTDTADAFGNR